MSRNDGIGRRAGLKIQWWRHRAGSTPASGTKAPECYSIQALYFFSSATPHALKQTQKESLCVFAACWFVNDKLHRNPKN